MFSPYLSDIEHSNKKGYIYLFKILIDNNSFKFGHTTKNIKERLSGYRYHIYDIHYANCSLVKEREYLIKKYLLNDILFNRIQGKEYFSGPFDKIVEVFKYISNLDEEIILYYIRNKDKCLDITVCNKINEKEEEKNNEIENEEDNDNDTENENKTEDEDENKNNKSIKCTICDKTFTSNRTLSLHLKSHNRIIKDFKCMYCDITLASKQSLDRHITLCTSKKDYEKYHNIQSKIQNDFDILKYENEVLKKENLLLIDENIYTRESVKTKDLIIKNLENKIKNLEIKKDILYEKVITLQQDITTILNKRK